MNPGRIITFYSYKGGTGRSMALATTAWILASNKKRVLVIDWDLEAPGLHRYFAPFIDDEEFNCSSGVIDFFRSFAEGARTEKDEPSWFQRYTDLQAYAFSLHWEFPEPGCLDFIPAGRPGPSYSSNITTFDWSSFYDELGGGIFIEAVKKRLRREYDYILIDSRTGLSDTSGICTIQMPDELVVCFTLNIQSIRGAKAVADSAWSQRIKPSGEPGLLIWPVPTRVELADKEKLELARGAADSAFRRFVSHLPRAERQDYLGKIEVPYDAYYAYEEVLPAFADRPHLKLSVLSATEALVSYISRNEVTRTGAIAEELRKDTLKRFARSANDGPLSSGYFYLDYVPEDRKLAMELKSSLVSRLGENTVLSPDSDGADGLIRGATAVLAVFTPGRIEVERRARTASPGLALATQSGVRIIPLLFGARFSDLRNIKALSILANMAGFDRLFPGDADDALMLAEKLRVLLESRVDDPDDPHAGRFGRTSERSDRRLTAKITQQTSSWFILEITVAGTREHALTGPVEFYLHPSFKPELRRVSAENNAATLRIGAYGPFTVGAVADEGRTRLELNLATVPKAPRAFSSR